MHSLLSLSIEGTDDTDNLGLLFDFGLPVILAALGFACVTPKDQGASLSLTMARKNQP